MFQRIDPRGYYSALGVANTASADQIKAAFKARAQEIHPDHNSAPDATQKFQFLNEAFRALNDPATRAEYDASCFADVQQEERTSQHSVEPIRCSICARVSAQPRYAIYYQVASVIIASYKHVSQGVFCSKCAARTAFRASLITAVAGWWGFPLGPIWSAQALLRNLRGGLQPADSNFRMLACQAVYFASQDQFGLARAIAMESLAFAHKLTPSERMYESNQHFESAISNILSAPGTHSTVLPTVWGLSSRLFRLQATTLATIVLLSVGLAIFQRSRPKTAYRHTVPFGAETHAATIANLAAEGTVVFNQPALPSPSTGTMKQFDLTTRKTKAPFNIVTSDGSPNYYVKLVDSQTNRPELAVFVRSGETAHVEVPVGTYEFKYAMGETWYGEEFLFGPDTSYSKADQQFEFKIEGSRVAGYTVELTKQVDGNLKEETIPPSDF